jgi:hypothetical protein
MLQKIKYLDQDHTTISTNWIDYLKASIMYSITNYKFLIFKKYLNT